MPRLRETQEVFAYKLEHNVHGKETFAPHQHMLCSVLLATGANLPSCRQRCAPRCCKQQTKRSTDMHQLHTHYTSTTHQLHINYTSITHQLHINYTSVSHCAHCATTALLHMQLQCRSHSTKSQMLVLTSPGCPDPTRYSATLPGIHHPATCIYHAMQATNVQILTCNQLHAMPMCSCIATPN